MRRFAAVDQSFDKAFVPDTVLANQGKILKIFISPKSNQYDKRTWGDWCPNIPEPIFFTKIIISPGTQKESILYRILL